MKLKTGAAVLGSSFLWLSDTLRLSDTEAQDEQQSIIVGKPQRRTRPKIRRVLLHLISLQSAFQLRAAVGAGVAAAKIFDRTLSADRAGVADFVADCDIG